MNENKQNAAPEDEKIERTMTDRAKEVGRDGAYLECDARDLVKAWRSGELQKAKIVVITSARIEVSDPTTVTCLSDYVGNHVPGSPNYRPSEGTEGMSDEQLSLFVLQDSLFAGFEGCGCGQ